MKLCRVMMIAAILAVVALGLAACAHYPGLLIAFIVLAALLGGKKAYNLTAYGTARWANAGDLKRAGMLGGTGLPLGRINTGRPSAPISFAHVVVTNGFATRSFPSVRSSV